MKLKPIKASISHASPFGRGTFKHVPIMILDGVSAKDFDPEKDDYFIPVAVGVFLERQLAKAWINDCYPSEKSVFERKLAKEEVHAIMTMIGLTAGEFAVKVGVSKGQMSKVLAGDKTLSVPARMNCLALLSWELTEPGSVRSPDFLTRVKNFKPQFDLKAMKLA